MSEHASLIWASLRILSRHRRYIFWFWLANLTLAEFGTAVFRSRLHAVLDHSLLADRLLHGFDLGVYSEMVTRPEWGSAAGSATPAMYFTLLFLLVTLICLPGILEAYATEGRTSREQFFRCCGRNLFRFVRLFLAYGIVAGVIGGVLFSGHVGLVHASQGSTYELLPVSASVVTLAVLFLALTLVRIWFDLAQVDVVVQDQRAVRKSIRGALRYMRRNLVWLWSGYVAIYVLGLAILSGGIWAWRVFVPATSVLEAFLIAQVTLILLLAMRFWQRAAAVAFYMREMASGAPVYPARTDPALSLPGLTGSANDPGDRPAPA